MNFHKNILALTVVLYSPHMLTMDLPVKSALKKKAAAKKTVSFTANTKEEINEFPHTKTVILSGQSEFSPDSNYVIVSASKKLVLYEMQTGTCVGDLQNSDNSYENPSYTLLFSPSGKYVADKYRKYVWEVATRRLIHQDQQKGKFYVGWTPNEQTIISKKELSLHPKSLFYCQHEAIFTDENPQAFKMGFCNNPSETLSPNSAFLAFGPTSYNGECYQTLFELPHGKEICTIPKSTVTQFTPNSKYALFGMVGAKLLIVETKNGSTLKEVDCNVFSSLSDRPLFIESIKINAIRALVRTSRDHSPSAWKIPEGHRLSHFESSCDRILSNTGRFTIMVTNLNTENKTGDAILEDSLTNTKNTLLRKMPTTRGMPIFSPDDKVVIFRTGELFDTHTGKLLYSRTGYDNLRFSSNEKHLLVYNGKSDELVSFNRENI